MTWNWQQPDWPNFTWDQALLRNAEKHFLIGTGLLAGTLRHLAATDQEQLTIDALGSEALTTSEIEGEILDRASVQSSIRRTAWPRHGQTPGSACGARNFRNDGAPLPDVCRTIVQRNVIFLARDAFRGTWRRERYRDLPERKLPERKRAHGSGFRTAPRSHGAF
jgi:hypothetical protein